MKPRPRMFNIGNLSPQALRQSTGLARVVCLALVAFAPGLAAIKSGAAEMPGAEEVLQRHVEAVGGATALRKPHNLVYKGEADLIPLKVKAPIEFLVQAPDRFLLRLKYHYAFFGMIRVPFVGVRQPECGYDGTNGWTVDFDRRLEPLPSSEAVSYRALLDKFSPLYFSRDFRLTRTLDIARFAERLPEELTISSVEWDNVPETVFEPPSDLKVALERKTLAEAK